MDLLQLGYAPLLVMDSMESAIATDPRQASAREALSLGRGVPGVTETQVVVRRHWRHLTAQIHREPLCVSPTLVPPVPLTQVILQLSGAMRMEILKVRRYRSYQTGPGTLYLTAPHQPAYEINWRNLTPEPVHTLHLFLDNDLLAQTAAADAALDAATLELRDGSCLDDPLLCQLAYAMARELESPEAGYDLYADTVACMLAAQLVRQHGAIKPQMKERCQGKLSAKQVCQLRDYVLNHLREAISLDALARVASLSPYHFCRVFKRTTGQSPNQYVISQRMAQAAHLLRHTRLTIAHIASEVGYQSVRHFTVLFHRHMGSLPAEYARRRLFRRPP